MRYAGLVGIALLVTACKPIGGEAEPVPPTSAEVAESARAAALAIDIPESDLVAARWSMADGSSPPPAGDAASGYHRGHAVLDALGPALVASEEGVPGGTTGQSEMLVLSSGTAARGDDPGFAYDFKKGYLGTTPAGFPKESPSCPGAFSREPFDDAALEVTLLPPPSARGLAFDFAFLTFEWPVYVCTRYNDFFVALVDPVPAGLPDGNVSFDAIGNPISVNAAFLDHCKCPGGGACATPPDVGAKTYTCGHGSALLDGTPFASDRDDVGWSHGSTGWLRTTVPVVRTSAGRETMTIRFAVWDASDPWLDTTVLVDGFRWIYDVDVGVETSPAETRTY